MGSRRHARETALQMMYLCDNCHLTPDDARSAILSTSASSLSQSVRAFALELFDGLIVRKADLDRVIEQSAENWELNRMASIDRNILRMAAYEMTDMPDTPINVIINEAVDIAKRFSTAESGKFVNGILDNMKTVRNTKSAESHKG
jgi:N utilization substance protein B